MTRSNIRYPEGGAHAWGVWGAAAGIYFVAVFHRTSLSVAGIAAAERFHASPSQLATFMGLQLIVYAAMQLPVGILLDRFGSRRLLTGGIALMTAGQLGFAVSPSYPLALLSRVIVGLGDAMTFLSVLRLVAVWFPEARKPLLTQLTAIAGQLGAMLAALPIVGALHRFGWAPTYAGAAIIGLVVGGVMYVVVIDQPTPTDAPRADSLRMLLRGVQDCWSRPYTRVGAWIYCACLFFPSLLTLLWGYPYLVDGHGASPQLAAALLTMLLLVSIAGGPIVGALVGRWPRVRLPLVCWWLAAAIVAWTLVLVWPGPAPSWTLVLLMVVAGAGSPIGLVGFDFASTSTPATQVGAAMALVNVTGYAATIAVIFGIGLVLDLLTPPGSSHYSAHAFSLAMLVPYPVWLVTGVQIWRCARRVHGPGDLAYAAHVH
ncbi:MAG TPA: MFS transporter [Rhodanobacteraceae bacterium]|nr:MFS transporter [Rhodanobacteraceae bacterium]